MQNPIDHHCEGKVPDFQLEPKVPNTIANLRPKTIIYTNNNKTPNTGKKKMQDGTLLSAK